jgi:hypothetical protein
MGSAVRNGSIELQDEVESANEFYAVYIIQSNNNQSTEILSLF